MNGLICLNPSDTNAKLFIPIRHFSKGFVFAYVFPVQAKNAQATHRTTQVYSMRHLSKQMAMTTIHQTGIEPEFRFTFGLATVE